jgi:transcriptional regulator with XRE-family HTH domain
VAHDLASGLMSNGRGLGDFIRELRTDRKLTQDECAKLIRVSRQTWMGWERGVVPAAVNLLDLAAWSGRTVDDLVRMCVDRPDDAPTSNGSGDPEGGA